MQGSCFCGEVSFEIKLNKIEAYHCHCSICRKVTGSKFNTAFTLDADSFVWTGKTDGIKRFQKNGQGFSNYFCSSCGCTVPNRYKDKYFWVPAGLMADDSSIELVRHIFVESRATWDEIIDDLPQYEGYP
ncbi:MAG: GFA family protein [Gammaproteobacteria bacterium]|nr:GFA family protein [Gammaproteobacteria bacterium]